MESSLQDLLAAITEERVLTPEVFSDIDCDEILTSREDGEFEREWNRVSNLIDKEWGDRDADDEVEGLIEDIREHSFQIASQATDEHELAGFIADDFELFARAIAIEITDPFLESLWEAYENGEIPSPASIQE
ncbi:MAG: hypothetical protein KGS60_06255 [Verrucomicrobia bacterium]|jgi:hypothetical protein|nr:hypothetical protein [Verrucomicrobiota bacterium]